MTFPKRSQTIDGDRGRAHQRWIARFASPRYVQPQNTPPSAPLLPPYSSLHFNVQYYISPRHYNPSNQTTQEMNYPPYYTYPSNFVPKYLWKPHRSRYIFRKSFQEDYEGEDEAENIYVEEDSDTKEFSEKNRQNQIHPSVVTYLNIHPSVLTRKFNFHFIICFLPYLLLILVSARLLPL